MAADDDFLTPSPDQGFSPDFDTGSSTSGNRPASGARRATPGEVLSQSFHGAQNAGDFLGLDVEFTGSQGPDAYDQSAQTPLDLVAPPGTYQDDGSAAAQTEYLEPAPMPEGDPVQEFAQAPSAFEFGEDLGSDEETSGFGEASASPSKAPLFVSALLVAVLTTVGVLYGPKLYSEYFGSAPEVAKAPEAPAPKPRATVPPAASTSAPVPQVAVEPTPRPAPEAVATPEPSTTGASDPESTPIESDPFASLGTETPSPVEAVPSSTPPAVSTPVTQRPKSVGFPDLGGGAYDWASEDKLELIWRGSEVPLEALKAPAKTIMPRVGNVRVFTTSGDVFEGRLYAVGQNRVWLDTTPGRVGLDGDRVQRIDVLPPEETQVASSDLSQIGKSRVRVRVPGGLLYGSVLKAEGDEVTLALDDGGRVRVKADDVQDLGTNRAVVVRR